MPDVVEPPDAPAAVAAAVAPQVLPPLNAEGIVEEAEEMLRQAAPHDFDVLVIGGGPGGCAAALRAAELGARVALVEGDESERGIGPLAPFSRLAAAAGLAGAAGGVATRAGLAFLNNWPPGFAAELQASSPHRQHELKAAGVQVVAGQAHFHDEHAIVVESGGVARKLRGVYLIVAVGCRHEMPDFQVAAPDKVCSLAQLMLRPQLPRRLAVAGNGAVALELACLYQSLGSTVTLFHAGPLLPGFVGPLRQEWLDQVRSNLPIVEGDIQIVEQTDDHLVVAVSHQERSSTAEIETDLLVSASDQPATSTLNLSGVGISTHEQRILVDVNLQTIIKGVYAVGDCVHPNGRVSVAVAEGRAAAEHAMGRTVTSPGRTAPCCYYTRPPVAWAGLSAQDGPALGMAVESRLATWHDPATSSDGATLVHLLLDASSGVIIGCQVIGSAAEPLINLASLAIGMGATAAQLSSHPFAGPGCASALAQAAAKPPL